MRCLICNSSRQTIVLDSRPLSDDTETRRRRRCLDCGARFTTIERARSAKPDKRAVLAQAFKIISTMFEVVREAMNVAEAEELKQQTDEEIADAIEQRGFGQ